jgi:hypothetical protein
VGSTLVELESLTDLTILEAAHEVSTHSANSADIVLTETKKTADGTLLLTAFHTDPTLMLRRAASGLDAANLQLVPADDEAAWTFREMLLTWDRALRRKLETPTTK